MAGPGSRHWRLMSDMSGWIPNDSKRNRLRQNLGCQSVVVDVMRIGAFLVGIVVQRLRRTLHLSELVISWPSTSPGQQSGEAFSSASF